MRYTLDRCFPNIVTVTDTTVRSNVALLHYCNSVSAINFYLLFTCHLSAKPFLCLLGKDFADLTAKVTQMMVSDRTTCEKVQLIIRLIEGHSVTGN